MGDGFGLDTISDWDHTFCELVRCAKMTFFEIPNREHPKETPHRIREWYRGRDELDVLQSAIKRCNLDAAVEYVGAIPHGQNQGVQRDSPDQGGRFR